jgi:hypothetical protein
VSRSKIIKSSNLKIGTKSSPKNKILIWESTALHCTGLWFINREIEFPTKKNHLFSTFQTFQNLPPDLTLAARFEDDLSQLIKKVIPPRPGLLAP